MPPDSLSVRLAHAMHERELAPVALARKCGTSEATISNWLNGKVRADHVKAALLVRMAQALAVAPAWLLFGEGSPSQFQDAEPPAGALSHPLTPDTLRCAIELVTDVLDAHGLPMSASKRAEMMLAVYEMLQAGLPEAQIMRFVRAAAA